MAYPYIDTPRTDIDGNATYLTNGYRSAGRTHLSALDSVENSFHTPSKNDDVIKILGDGCRRSSGGFKLGTPRAGSGPKTTRSALSNQNNDLHRRHLPTIPPAKGEFTPLMKSATKNNFLRSASAAQRANGSVAGVPKTPAYLKPGYRSNGNTPGLPPVEMTDIYEEDTTDDPTPLPQVASSSAQSTPLPTLPGRNGAGVVSDGQSMMTLKEQEKMIDKLDKDNFGLKLKIHYLQEQLTKMGPGYQQEAIKENTELKVAKMTMLRDIARYKKNLLQAERDLENYQQQLLEMRDKARRKQTDDSVREEMDRMREEIETRDNQISQLRCELREAKDSQSQEIEKLRDEIEDLEASSREKDRMIDERDDEIDRLKENDNREDAAVSDLKAELENAKQRAEDLQERLEQAEFDLRQAKQAEERSAMEKEHAEEKLRELQDDVADKSFTSKGSSRHLEEKLEKLEERLRELQREKKTLEDELDSKAQHEERLEEQFQKVKHDFNEERQRLLDEIDLARRERDIAQEEHDTISAQMHEALDEAQRKADEKDLLHTRHRALTDESSGLQRELDKAISTIRALEEAAEDEQQRAQDNAEVVQTRHREDLERLQDEIERLHNDVQDKEGRFALEQDKWESAKRTLQMQKERAEEQAAGFRRTIEKLQEVEHTLSGKESKLQEVIDSEKTRHLQEESVLSRQVQELNQDLASKRQLIDDQRSELISLKEEIRLATREEQALRDKVQSLEDEVVILQASLREEQEFAQAGPNQGTSDVDTRMERAIAEKQRLRDQLVKANGDLSDTRASLAELQAERDELQEQLDRVQGGSDHTHHFDKEKIDLCKLKVRLESEVARLKEEKSSLSKAKESLENQLNAEIERATEEENRLSIEIDQLQDALLASSGSKDRELTKARSKLQRLERRVHELEAQIAQHGPADHEASTSNGDISMLRHNLDEARKREKLLLQREADQKASVRSYKSRVGDLEKELHDALMRKYSTQSPLSSPADKLHDELRAMRKQLSEAHKSLRDLKTKNRELERAAMREEEQRDLNELLKASTIEAESLALQVSEREARVNELTGQVRRIREERAFCAKKAEQALADLEMLQKRYDQLVDGLGTKSDTSKTRHEKEMRGLGKEIIWLRARLKREERFRKDLAWSKGLMELGERVRVACNEADLRMIAEMGVKPRDRSKVRSPRRKLKTAISMVVAAIRMQKLGQQWTKAKKLGEGLKRAKDELLKRRKEVAAST